ncbi:hypothetical protein L1887_63367 [Cichorium endivia]|nr:hypothetical protein L1887_63367 [Cichorium endivia]
MRMRTLEAAIEGDHLADAGRCGGEVGEVVERVDERQSGGAVDGSAVVDGGRRCRRSPCSGRGCKRLEGVNALRDWIGSSWSGRCPRLLRDNRCVCQNAGSSRSLAARCVLVLLLSEAS